MGAIFIAWLLVGALAGPPDQSEFQRFEFAQTEMAIPISIIMYAPDSATAAKAAETAFDRIHALNSILSDYDEESELRRLCRTSSEGNPIPVSNDLWRVLQFAGKLSEQTDGAFDVTIGPLTHLWRRTRRLKELPSTEAIKAALTRVDYRAIRLNSDRQSVELLKPNMLLDLGGIAKGYALEEAYRVLEKRGITCVLIHAGGDMVIGEPPPGKSGWKIGIGQAEREAPPRFYLSLAKTEMATSGDRFQYVEIGGKRYSHLIDPKTGMGLTNRCQTTVVVPLGTLADGLASSICILGPQKGMKMLEKVPGAAAYIIELNEKEGKEEIRMSKSWEKLPHTEGE